MTTVTAVVTARTARSSRRTSSTALPDSPVTTTMKETAMLAQAIQSWTTTMTATATGNAAIDLMVPSDLRRSDSSSITPELVDDDDDGDHEGDHEQANEGNTTPPLEENNGSNSNNNNCNCNSSTAMTRNKKKNSPVSAMNFEDAEEMKISQHDQDQYIVHMVHKLAPPPLTTTTTTTTNQQQQQQQTTTEKKSPPPKEKPPLRPNPKRLQTNLDDDNNNTNNNKDASFHGEQAMMALAQDCLLNDDCSTALALYKSLFLELDRLHGRNHPQVALCLHKIGESHLLLGNFEKSIKYLETAIAIRTVLGNATTITDSMDRLAVAKLHLNHVGDAHDIYSQTLRLKQNRLGFHHEEVAHIHTQLGCIYYYSGEVLSAQASFQNALYVYRELAAGQQHNNIWTIKAADALCSIGSIKLTQKKFSKAIDYFADALKSQKQVYGIYHPVVITTLDNLGYAHTKCKSYTVASEVYEEMLHAQVTYHRGCYTLECYQSLKKLNVVYEKMDKLYAAIDATLEAIALQQQSSCKDATVVSKTRSLLKRLETKLLTIEGQQQRRS